MRTLASLHGGHPRHFSRSLQIVKVVPVSRIFPFSSLKFFQDLRMYLFPARRFLGCSHYHPGVIPRLLQVFPVQNLPPNFTQQRKSAPAEQDPLFQGEEREVMSVQCKKFPLLIMRFPRNPGILLSFLTVLYHRERILETSTLSCNEEEEEITKPPKR